MHVMWICSARVWGGAEAATLELMRRLRARAHGVTVLCPSASRVEGAAQDAGLTVQRAPLGGRLNPSAYGAIAAAFASRAPDVALVSTIDEWVGACVVPRAKTALVLVRHMDLPVARGVRWLARQRADAIVAVSDTVRTTLCRDGVLAADQVAVIHNPTRFTPRSVPPTAAERAQAREALRLTAPGNWVGFCGGYNRKKGVADVIAAVNHVNAELGSTNLLLCGRTDPRDENAAARSERQRIVWLGESEQMEIVYTAADVIVMATRRELSEALPATLMEAMACGTPVLAYATGGMAEVIGNDTGAGRLARPDDAADLARVLVDMLRDPLGRAELARRGLQRIREIGDPERAVDRYEQLFERLVAKRQISG